MTLKMTFVHVAAIALLVPFCYGSTGFDEIKQCVVQWTLNNKIGNSATEKHCDHLRLVVPCFDKEPTLENGDAKAVIDDWRFINEQQLRFQEKYHFCDPKIDHSKLTKLLLLSGTKKKYKSYILDHDYPAPCAVDSYKKCLKKYYDVYPDERMCADASILFDCLNEEAKTTCKTTIMKHLASTFNDFGKNAVNTMNRIMPKVCDLSKT